VKRKTLSLSMLQNSYRVIVSTNATFSLFIMINLLQYLVFVFSGKYHGALLNLALSPII